MKKIIIEKHIIRNSLSDDISIVGAPPQNSVVPEKPREFFKGDILEIENIWKSGGTDLVLQLKDELPCMYKFSPDEVSLI